MNKTILNSALALAFGLTGMGTGHAANSFSFTGGGPSVSGGLAAPTGSWFSMLAMDTNSDLLADANVYTAIRAAGGAGVPGPVGSLDFSVAHTVNQIDRLWSFFGQPGQHFTTSSQPMICAGNAGAPGAACNVDMAGWRVFWNGITINMGGGGSATLSAGNDGVWNTGDETLDYTAIVPNDGLTAFGGVNYGLHMVGTYDMTTAIASAFPPTFAVLDADNDGVLDAQDSAPNNNKIASPPSATSTGKITVTITAGALTLVRTWSDTDASLNQATKPAGVVFKDGLVDYTITGIGPGTVATIVIAYPSAVTAGLAYYKVKSTGLGAWTKMDPASANNPNGGFSVAPDGKTVTLTILDGGIYDDDGAANGSIHDPGGLGSDAAAAPSIPGVEASSGGCAYNPNGKFDLGMLLALFGSLGYLGWRRARQ
ncbi:MAG: JDVT-CTERM domain-containing protein [Gammaproteobacteria bacterium]|nr:JDVT-CTERM domain-containing protein [Gammaproteobacteria bacterium]